MILNSGFLVLGRGIADKLKINTIAIGCSPDRISGGDRDFALFRSSQVGCGFVDLFVPGRDDVFDYSEEVSALRWLEAAPAAAVRTCHLVVTNVP
jgi:hypothetical protein